MKPVRVAHVIWRLSPTGGIPRLVRDLLVSIDPTVAETWVVTIRPPYAEDRLAEVIDDAHLDSARHPLGASRWLLPRALLRATKALRRIEPDVIHLHSGTSWFGLPAALTMRSRRLLEIHDDPASRRSRALNVAVMRLSARRLGFEVLVNSSVVRDRTARAFDLEPERITVVRLGVDTTVFRSDPELREAGRRRLGVDDDHAVVAWVGRLDPMKRPEDAVAVARTVIAKRPSTVFALAGTGTEHVRLTAAVAAEPRIRLLGAVEDLAEFLNAADVFLSTSAYEGFGLGVAEAMACGLPVVSTRAGGVVDVVSEPDTGFLVPVGDLGALARCVDALLGDPALARAMGEAGRAVALETLTRDAMARRYEGVYTAPLSDGDR